MSWTSDSKVKSMVRQKLEPNSNYVKHNLYHKHYLIWVAFISSVLLCIFLRQRLGQVVPQCLSYDSEFFLQVWKFTSLHAQMPLKHPVAMLSLVAHYVMQRAGGKPGALGACQIPIVFWTIWLGVWGPTKICRTQCKLWSRFNWKAISKDILDMICQKLFCLGWHHRTWI